MRKLLELTEKELNTGVKIGFLGVVLAFLLYFTATGRPFQILFLAAPMTIYWWYHAWNVRKVSLKLAVGMSLLGILSALLTTWDLSDLLELCHIFIALNTPAIVTVLMSLILKKVISAGKKRTWIAVCPALFFVILFSLILGESYGHYIVWFALFAAQAVIWSYALNSSDDREQRKKELWTAWVATVLIGVLITGMSSYYLALGLWSDVLETVLLYSLPLLYPLAFRKFAEYIPENAWKPLKIMLTLFLFGLLLLIASVPQTILGSPDLLALHIFLFVTVYGLEMSAQKENGEKEKLKRVRCYLFGSYLIRAILYFILPLAGFKELTIRFPFTTLTGLICDGMLLVYWFLQYRKCEDCVLAAAENLPEREII